MSRFGLISLDLTGTVYKFSKPPFVTYNDFAKANDIPLAEHKIKSSFAEAYKEAKTHYPNFGQGSLPSSKTWWSKIVFSTFKNSLIDGERLDLMKASKISNELYEYYTTPEAYYLYPDVKPFLEDLRTLDLKIGVISNSDRRIHRILDGLGLKDFFDFILSSEEVGCMKPDSRIFERALEFTAKESDCLHIGDDIEKDFFAPRKDARWNSILLQRNGVHPKMGIEANEIFDNLKDVFVRVVQR